MAYTTNTDWERRQLNLPKSTRRQRTLITSPLVWQMAVAPVPHFIITILAEHGGWEVNG